MHFIARTQFQALLKLQQLLPMLAGAIGRQLRQIPRNRLLPPKSNWLPHKHYCQGNDIYATNTPYRPLSNSMPSLLIHANFSTHKPSLPSKLDAYYRLCRWHLPIGAMLLYWPTAWGVCLGCPGVPDPFYLLLFLMGSWTARSAGCIVNDYFDRDFDQKVERTKTRPLASGEVSTTEAAALLFLNLCGGLYVLYNMPTPAIATAFAFVGLGGVYPLAKRFTNYPQLVLGMSYNSGIIIACMSTGAQAMLPVVVPMYASGIAWTLIYDTVYAYQDIQDDLKIGVKSTAVTWRDRNPKLIMERLGWAMMACHALLPLFDLNYLYVAPLLLGCDWLLIKELRRLELDNRRACGDFFKRNNIYGLGVFAALALAGCIKAYKNEATPNK